MSYKSNVFQKCDLKCQIRSRKLQIKFNLIAENASFL